MENNNVLKTKLKNYLAKDLDQVTQLIKNNEGNRPLLQDLQARKEKVLKYLKICNDPSFVDESKIAKFKVIAKNMVDTYERKNHDYGNSFGKSITKYGAIAGLVRLSDKFNRIENLILHNLDNKVKDESIKDTLLDLANYAIMLYIELDKEEERDE